MKKFAPLLLLLICPMFAGCPVSQNTAAALVGIAGTAVTTLESLEGHTDAATKLSKDFAAAQTAILNFKQGSVTQDVAEALALVQDDLNLLPVSTQDEAYINLAIGTINALLDLFPAQAGAVVSAHAVLVPHRTIVSNTPAPKTAKQFKAQWNAIPGGLAPLK